jgi:hypothetical protein
LLIAAFCTALGARRTEMSLLCFCLNLANSHIGGIGGIGTKNGHTIHDM